MTISKKELEGFIQKNPEGAREILKYWVSECSLNSLVSMVYSNYDFVELFEEEIRATPEEEPLKAQTSCYINNPSAWQSGFDQVISAELERLLKDRNRLAEELRRRK